jgi:hypothetical protein
VEAADEAQAAPSGAGDAGGVDSARLRADGSWADGSSSERQP